MRPPPANAVDEYESEPLVFLARRGDFTMRSWRKLEADADEAAERVGADRERIGSGAWIGPISAR